MSTASADFTGQAASVGTEGHARASGKATWALVLGIASFLLPIFAAIGAIMLGREAQREIAASPQLTGAGRAKAGVVLGWINVGLAAIIFAGILVFGIIGA